MAAQIASSVVLLVGTGLLGRSFLELNRVPIGFDAAERYLYRVSMPDDSYPWNERAGLLRAFLAGGQYCCPLHAGHQHR